MIKNEYGDGRLSVINEMISFCYTQIQKIKDIEVKKNTTRQMSNSGKLLAYHKILEKLLVKKNNTIINERKMHISDFLEKEIASTLDNIGIKYIHESQNNKSSLDFYIPKHDVYIEVKQYHTDRVLSQLRQKENVILVQGKKSLQFFKNMLSNDTTKTNHTIR